MTRSRVRISCSKTHHVSQWHKKLIIWVITTVKPSCRYMMGVRVGKSSDGPAGLPATSSKYSLAGRKISYELNELRVKSRLFYAHSHFLTVYYHEQITNVLGYKLILEREEPASDRTPCSNGISCVICSRS